MLSNETLVQGAYVSSVTLCSTKECAFVECRLFTYSFLYWGSFLYKQIRPSICIFPLGTYPKRSETSTQTQTSFVEMNMSVTFLSRGVVAASTNLSAVGRLRATATCLTAASGTHTQQEFSLKSNLCWQIASPINPCKFTHCIMDLISSLPT